MPTNEELQKQLEETLSNMTVEEDAGLIMHLNTCFTLGNKLREFAKGTGCKPNQFYYSCLMIICSLAQGNKASLESVSDDLKSYWDLTEAYRDFEETIKEDEE